MTITGAPAAGGGGGGVDDADVVAVFVGVGVEAGFRVRVRVRAGVVVVGAGSGVAELIGVDGAARVEVAAGTGVDAVDDEDPDDVQAAATKHRPMAAVALITDRMLVTERT
jgi:hypothetical protein